MQVPQPASLNKEVRKILSEWHRLALPGMKVLGCGHSSSFVQRQEEVYVIATAALQGMAGASDLPGVDGSMDWSRWLHFANWDVACC